MKEQQKGLRERMAFVVFLLLSLFGLSLIALYISGMSYSLNVAASTVDDVTGNLSDYTAIVYEGTLDEASSTKDNPSDSLALNNQAQTQDESAHRKEASATQVLSDVEDESNQSDRPLSIDDVVAQYHSKNAPALVLHPEDLARYDKRSSITVGERTFALIPISSDTTLAQVELRLAQAQRQKVDAVIAIVNDLKAIKRLATQADKAAAAAEKAKKRAAKDPDPEVELKVPLDKADQADTKFSAQSFDMIISQKDEGLLPGGVQVDGVFYADACEKGTICSVLVSPSMVFSGKELTQN